MKTFSIVKILSLSAAMLVLAMSIVLATPEQEKALLEVVNQQMNILLDPQQSKNARVQALRALNIANGQMKKLADADPNFDQRKETDEFNEMNQGMSEFLADEAKNLGVDLNEAPVEIGVDAAGGACPASPLPKHGGHPKFAQPVKDVQDTYSELIEQLREPPGESFQAIADQRNIRDRRLEAYILAQIKYVWAAAGKPSVSDQVKLLQARDNFEAHLKDKRDADDEEWALMVHLSELQEQFQGLKRQVTQGKSVPGFLELDSEAQRTIKRIMELRSRSSESYGEFLAIIEPMEASARELFNEQMNRGLDQIAYQHRQEGYEGAPFQLFKPKTGNEQRMMNKIIGSWLAGELGIIGARASEPWADWGRFKDFNFDTEGLSTDECPAPEDKPDDQSSVPSDETPPEEEMVCTGGGLLGAMNCVAKKIGG